MRLEFMCIVFTTLATIPGERVILLTQDDESFDMARETWEEQQIFVGGAESSCQYCCSVVLVALLNCNRVPAQSTSMLFLTYEYWLLSAAVATYVLT